jgi:hypothetical protein
MPKADSPLANAEVAEHSFFFLKGFPLRFSGLRIIQAKRPFKYFFIVSEFQSLCKKYNKKNLTKSNRVDKYPSNTEIHGEFFKRIFVGYKTQFKLCFLCFSLWCITEK